ncbi:hypothetical protein ACWGI8_08675 [Streptomyces sp. NPDC054841]
MADLREDVPAEAEVALRDGLRGSAVQVVDFDTHINDPSFGRAAADRLHRLITGTRAKSAADCV